MTQDDRRTKGGNASGRGGVGGVGGGMRSGGARSGGGQLGSGARGDGQLGGRGGNGGLQGGQRPVGSHTRLDGVGAGSTQTRRRSGGAGVSRRGFLIGGGVLCVAAIGGGAVWGMRSCSRSKAEDAQSTDDYTGISAQDEDFEALSPAEDALDSVMDYGEVEQAGVAAVIAQFDLDIGCVIHACEDDHAIVLAPSGTRRSLVKLSRLNLESGYMGDVLADAVSADEGYEIYDARGNGEVVAWVEVEILSGAWRVYMAPWIGEYELNEAKLLDEGVVEYDPPWICVCGTHAVWAVMPDANGTASSEDTLVKTQVYTEAQATLLYTSHGRLCCNPQASGGIVTIAPRVDTSLVYYRLIAVDMETMKSVDTVVLPKSMAASDAVYMKDHFVFCIEQTYDYGETIGDYGTYWVKDAENVTIYQRTPTCPPAWSGEWMLVKSTQSVVGINPTKRHYFVMDPMTGGANYGDFLATIGQSDRIVTYTTVSDNKGTGGGVTRVRVLETYEDTEAATAVGEGYSLDDLAAAEDSAIVTE